MATILVATAEGLLTFGDDGARGTVQLAGRLVTFVARDDAELWAILEGTELWRTDGREWVRVATLGGERGTCLAFTDAWLVGTSGARLFRVTGDSVDPVVAFDRAPGREAWFTPWGGPPDTRSISEWGEHVYVNVHVGGILRTGDGGASWVPTIDIDADVHQVATSGDLVLAACAGGLATSRDRGVTWTFRTEGLERRYSRAVTVCGETLLVSASSGPRGGHAALYRIGLRGDVFERCISGLPEWFEGNIDTHHLDAAPDAATVAFGTSDGRVYVSRNEGSTWDEVADGLPVIQRVLVMP